MSTSSLLFGTIGLGYFIDGKKRQRFVPLLAGRALISYPCFVSNTRALVVTGLGLMAVPRFPGF
jgi:hypothetical protein